MKKKYIIKRAVTCMLCLALALVMLTLCACNTATAEDLTEAETAEPVMVKAVRVKDNVAAGTALGVKNLDLVDIDANTLPEGYLTKLSDATGRVLAVDVMTGDFLTASMLEAKESAKSEDEEKPEINEETAREKGYVVVTDHIQVVAGVDVTEKLQALIDSNPKSTIYFPDGTYTISDSLLTSSDPEKAVSLHLSNFAIIQASYDWKGGDKHMIRLGAKDKTFSIDDVGSNYYLYGGIIDGSGVANGVSVEGGRETSIRYVSMKFVKQGLHIMYNEECESSDVDVQTVNIVGCCEKDSIGVLVDGYDNTLTNMRVARFQFAIKLNGARNTLRNLHMLWVYNNDKFDYEDSIGFWDTSEGNWYDICYPDNFAVGFRTSGHTVSVYNNCYAYWYSKTEGETQIGFASDGQFNSIVKNYRVDLRDEKVAKFMVVAEEGGTGIVEYPIFPDWRNEDDTYKTYLVGKVIWQG